MTKKKARLIAFYLPQFHPIPQNDEWWGKGFTEWTNVGKAKPLFRGHYQPRVPADLGYYDLRLPEIREAQAEMAKKSGVEGFMYWHYWFGEGKTLLERPFQEVLESGNPDFPFSLGWANHSWENKTWDSREQYGKSKMLIEQKYLGESDYIAHFNYVLPAFKDKRYITIDDKPIFLLYMPLHFKDVSNFIQLWQKLAVENGLKGIHFVGQAHWNADCDKILNLGFDAVCRNGINDAANNINGKILNKILAKFRNRLPITPLNKFKYSKIVNNLVFPIIDSNENIYPSVVPNFDHSPRSKRKGLIYTHSTPALFKKLLEKTVKNVQNKEEDHKIIFLRSWNEWAEGNYVEPDLKFGHEYLNVIKDSIFEI